MTVQVAVADDVERGHVADLAGVDQHPRHLDRRVLEAVRRPHVGHRLVRPAGRGAENGAAPGGKVEVVTAAGREQIRPT